MTRGRPRPGRIRNFGVDGQHSGPILSRQTSHASVRSRFVQRVIASTLPCLLLIVCGCPQPRPAPIFTPMAEAIHLIETNASKVHSALRARGSARGYFLDDRGVRRRYDLEAKLLVRPPDHLRFVMEHALSGDELRVGMNPTKWWMWVRRPREQAIEGRRGDEEPNLAGNIPVHADQLVEALGLNRLANHRFAQRVVDDYQQLLSISEDGERDVIECEYWLDRQPPRLIRRIVFRDREGRITLSSWLDQYRPISTGAMLPHLVRLRWPAQGAEMEFHIDRWREDDSLTDDHPAFVAPSDRANMMD